MNIVELITTAIYTSIKNICAITVSEIPFESGKKNLSHLVHLFLNQKQYFQLDPKSYSPDTAAHECWLYAQKPQEYAKDKYECANFEVIQRRVSSESQWGKCAFTIKRCGKHQFHQAIKFGIINGKPHFVMQRECVSLATGSSILAKTHQSASDHTSRPDLLYIENSGDRRTC